MFFNRMAVSLFEFSMMVVMSVVIIYVTYRVFIRANIDFDMEEEIKKGNVAVGTLVAAILFGASMILQQGLASITTLVRMRIQAPSESGFSLSQLALMCLGHFVMSLVLALLTISITLRLFGRMVRYNKLGTHMRPGDELKKGNVAVGILLASVVLVASLYVSQGLGSISRALIPQPSIGHIQVFK